MSIFRRKPKFKVGDRVMVNSLYLGSPGNLSWPLVRSFRDEFVGRTGAVYRVDPERWGGRTVVAILDNGENPLVCFHPWELRHA